MSRVPVHCMQGRLLAPEPGRFQAFPPRRWQQELELAARAGVEGIEWIYERYGEEANPLGSDTGVQRLRGASARAGVVVESLCGDWFIDRPLVPGDGPADAEVVEKLRWLLDRAAGAGIRRVVVPFVDASRLASAAAVRAAARALSEVAATAPPGVELHVESDLPADELAALVRAVGHPQVRINYDTGNSASLGYDPGEEFAAYGGLIGSVHIKDRVRGGSTVPLGTGDADIPRVLGFLAAIAWNRPLVLQAARGEDGAEVATTSAHVELVRGWCAQVGVPA